MKKLLLSILILVGCSPAFAWNNRTPTATFTVTKTFTPTATITPTITPTPNATEEIPAYNPPNTKNLYQTGIYTATQFGLPAFQSPTGLVLTTPQGAGGGQEINLGIDGSIMLRSTKPLTINGESLGVVIPFDPLNMGSNNINFVADPVGPHDASTKQYVIQQIQLALGTPTATPAP